MDEKGSKPTFLPTLDPFRDIDKNHTIVTEIITKLIRWEFSSVMFRSKITELTVGEFSSGNSLQDFVHGISSRVSWDGERQGVFGMGPNNYQINLFGILSGSDPLKNCRK